jgi:hypothetical protein
MKHIGCLGKYPTTLFVMGQFTRSTVMDGRRITHKIVSKHGHRNLGCLLPSFPVGKVSWEGAALAEMFTDLLEQPADFAKFFSNLIILLLRSCNKSKSRHFIVLTPPFLLWFLRCSFLRIKQLGGTLLDLLGCNNVLLYFESNQGGLQILNVLSLSKKPKDSSNTLNNRLKQIHH